MNLKFEQLFENIIVCGDIHGDIMPLIFKINETLKLKNSLIIVAGDVGIGFYKDGYYLNILSRASARLKKRNNILLFVRGNHDNPEKWNDYEPFKEYWQDGINNIRFIKDYTVISAHNLYEGHNILCVGGAISVDRTGRTPGQGYWPDEIFVYDETKIESLEGITDVITHSAPDFCEPILKNGIESWMALDSALEKDCTKERSDHTALYNKLKEKNQIKKWCYGHMHYSHTEIINETVFNLLGIMQFYELR